MKENKYKQKEFIASRHALEEGLREFFNGEKFSEFFMGWVTWIAFWAYENCVMRLCLTYLYGECWYFCFSGRFTQLHSGHKFWPAFCGLWFQGLVSSASVLQGCGLCMCVLQEPGWLGGGLSLPSVHIFLVPLGLEPHSCHSGPLSWAPMIHPVLSGSLDLLFLARLCKPTSTPNAGATEQEDRDRKK